MVFTIFNTAGRKTNVATMKEPMQMVRSFPILAMPRWAENERVLKLRMVVRVLKKRALAVLVSSMLPLGGGSVRKRWMK